VRRKISKSIAALIENHLRARLPQGNVKPAVDSIFRNFRKADRGQRIPPERTAEVLQGLAMTELNLHYQGWRRPVTPEEAVEFLRNSFLGQLDCDKAEHVDRNLDVKIAVDWMGPACAEALFLREWMGFADEHQNGGRYQSDCEHLNGARRPGTRLRWWLPCKCAGNNGFNDRQIAEAIGIDKDQVPGLLTEARRILDRRMNGHERKDSDE
jgi:hypothetical protein